MGLVREDLDVDFYVDPRPITKDEREKLVNIFVNTKQKWQSKKVVEFLTKRKRLLLPNEAGNVN